MRTNMPFQTRNSVPCQKSNCLHVDKKLIFLLLEILLPLICQMSTKTKIICIYNVYEILYLLFSLIWDFFLNSKLNDLHRSFASFASLRYHISRFLTL